MEFSSVLLIIISFLFSVIWALLFNNIKALENKYSSMDEKIDSHMEKNCKLHSVEIANHQMAISSLEKKMWSRDDLEKSVEKAVEKSVERAFLQWENKHLKEEDRR
jgi:predicted Holliday junction resolvase-like endonuclease